MKLAKLARGLVVAGALFWGTAAQAITVEEILNLVEVQVPTQVIVDTIEGSGTIFTTDDLRTLSDRGAPARGRRGGSP